MGKVFITDEVNDNYTADVTNAGKVKVEDGAAAYVLLNSAASIASGERVCSTPCYLKEVVIGRYPATAASLVLYNSSSATLGDLTAFGTHQASGKDDHIIAILAFPLGSGSGICALTYPVTNNAPYTIPFNVYCSSGIIAQISPSAITVADAFIGGMENITVSYQA